MGFDLTRETKDGRTVTGIASGNRKFRETQRNAYEIYCERVRTLATFFNWAEENPEKLTNALNFTGWNSPLTQQRLAEQEARMREEQENSQFYIGEYKKQRPNSIVFQIVDSANVAKNYGVPPDSPQATELYDGLVFRTVSLENTPFKNKENVALALEGYAKKKEEHEKQLKKEERAAKKEEKERVKAEELKQQEEINPNQSNNNPQTKEVSNNGSYLVKRRM